MMFLLVLLSQAAIATKVTVKGQVLGLEKNRIELSANNGSVWIPRASVPNPEKVRPGMNVTAQVELRDISAGRARRPK